MRVENIDCIPVKVPLIKPFETNFGRFETRKVVIVKLDSTLGTGVSEVPVFGPFYSYETVETANHIIPDYILPLIKNKELSNISDYKDSVSSIRGHPFAKSGVELALWDIWAKENNRPLYKELGGSKEKIPSQISIGVKDNPDQLIEDIKKGLDKGYRQIKIKIRPGWDIDVLEKVRREYPDISLMVDANAGYSLEDAKLLKKLDNFDLTMIEQPLSYDDLYNHSKLQSELETPVCLDESIHSLMDVQTAIELGSCQIINVKVARVGGLYEVNRIQKFCSQKGVDVWCGSMVGSGLEKGFNIAAATLPGFTFPNDITPSKTYFEEDLIRSQIKMDSEGFIEVPQRDGVGFEVNWDLIEKYKIE